MNSNKTKFCSLRMLRNRENGKLRNTLAMNNHCVFHIPIRFLYNIKHLPFRLSDDEKSHICNLCVIIGTYAGTTAINNESRA